MRRLLLLLVFFVMVIAGCTRNSVPAGPKAAVREEFPLRGKVVSTDAARGEVMVDHEAIPGFMDAMIMPYKLKDPSVLGELHPGDKITAKVSVVQDADGFHDALLDHIVITAQSQPDYLPAQQYHVPQAGDTVPDFHLLNQSGKIIHLAQFRGRVLLLTFIYTRCQLADYCPKMSRNFADIDTMLAANPALYGKTHLLSISFDPGYDTPAVLRSYGGAYTGNYTKEKFTHWDFAAPSKKDLPAVSQLFGVGVTPGENGSLTHSLSTVLIGPDGKVAAWYPTSDWSPAEVAAQMKTLAK